MPGAGEHEVDDGLFRELEGTLDTAEEQIKSITQASVQQATQRMVDKTDSVEAEILPDCQHVI